MQTAVKEALASAIARGVNPRGVHRARTVGASVRARRRVCSATGAEGGAAASAESRSEETRVARPPPLRTYYADWAEVILPDTRPDGEVSGHQAGARAGQVLEHHGAGALAGATWSFPAWHSHVLSNVPAASAPRVPNLPTRSHRAVHNQTPRHRDRRARRARGGLRHPRPRVRAHGKEGRAIGFDKISQVARSLASTGGTVATTPTFRPGTPPSAPRRSRAAPTTRSGTRARGSASSTTSRWRRRWRFASTPRGSRAARTRSS